MPKRLASMTTSQAEGARCTRSQVDSTRCFVDDRFGLVLP